MTDGAYYSWGWLHPSADAGGIAVLHVDYHHPVDGRVAFFDGIPRWRCDDKPWTGGTDEALTDRDAWGAFVSARSKRTQADRRHAIPELIVAHATAGDYSDDQVKAVGVLCRKADTFRVDVAEVRRVAHIDEETPMPTTATTTKPAGGQEYAVLPLDALIEAPDNPRGHIEIDEGFVEAIRAKGDVEVPLKVTGGGFGDGEYLIVAGHRRKAHAQAAGLTHVSCVIGHSTEEERLISMANENSFRRDLDPIGEAKLFKRLAELGMSQREIAKRRGCGQPHISKRLKLLTLPEPVQERVATGTEITLEQGMALAELPPESLDRVLTEEKLGDLAYALQSEQRRLKAAAAREKTAADLTKRGVLVADVSDDGWRYLRRDFNSTAKEPEDHDTCIAAVLTPHSNDVMWYCTDPDSHPAPKAPEQGQADEIVRPLDEEQQRRGAERQARDEAAARRHAVIADLVATAKPAKLLDDVALIIFDAMVEEFGGVLTAQLLDVESDKLRAAAVLNPFKALTALALSVSDQDLVDEDVLDDFPETRRLYQLLQQHGYEPTAEEAKVLADDDDSEAAA